MHRFIFMAIDLRRLKVSGIAQDTAAINANTATIVVKADSISRKAFQIVLNATLEKLR